jgi:hypothetical protein
MDGQRLGVNHAIILTTKTLNREWKYFMKPKTETQEDEAQLQAKLQFAAKSAAEIAIPITPDSDRGLMLVQRLAYEKGFVAGFWSSECIRSIRDA